MVIEKILKAIWDEFVYGGHLLSLGAVSIVYTASILLVINITWDFLLIVYLGTESVYLYNRFKEYKVDFSSNPERTGHIGKYVKKIPLIIFIFFLIILSILLYYKKFSSLIFVIILLILGLLYSIIFKNLTKKLIGFKSFFVSLTFLLLIIFLIFYYYFPLNSPLILTLTFFYLRFFIGTSFSDIKDKQSDGKKGLLTLAVVLGKRKLINVLSLANIIVAVPIILGVYLYLLPHYSLMLLLSIPYSFYYFKKLGDESVDTAYLYNVVVDGELTMWSIFILLGKFLL